MSLPKLNGAELATLKATHTEVRLPDPDQPGHTVTYCQACGHVMPCPTLRLVSEVGELRDTAQRYGESLHEDGDLRVHGGRRVC